MRALIKRLGRKLGDDSNKPTYVVNVRGRFPHGPAPEYGAASVTVVTRDAVSVANRDTEADSGSAAPATILNSDRHTTSPAKRQSEAALRHAARTVARDRSGRADSAVSQAVGGDPLPLVSTSRFGRANRSKYSGWRGTGAPILGPWRVPVPLRPTGSDSCRTVQPPRQPCGAFPG